jgi:PAS domain-containing protein
MYMRTNIFSASHTAKPEGSHLMQAVFDQTSIGIAVFDTSSGAGVSANPAFSTVFNLTLDLNKTWTLPQVFRLSGPEAEKWLTRVRSNSAFTEIVTLPEENEATLALQVRIEPLAGHPNLATLMVQPCPAAQPASEEPREAHTEAAHRLNEIETEYRLLIDSVSEVLCKVDRYGRWTFLNQAWTLITGYSPAQSLGKPVVQFIHADDRPAF